MCALPDAARACRSSNDFRRRRMAKVSKKKAATKKAAGAKKGKSTARVVPNSVFGVRRNSKNTPSRQILLAIDDATIVAKPAEAIVDIGGSIARVTIPGQFKIV